MQSSTGTTRCWGIDLDPVQQVVELALDQLS
jgi:hypothetical protein